MPAHEDKQAPSGFSLWFKNAHEGTGQIFKLIKDSPQNYRQWHITSEPASASTIIINWPCNPPSAVAWLCSNYYLVDLVMLSWRVSLRQDRGFLL